MNQSKSIFYLKDIRVLVQGPICDETEKIQGLVRKTRKRFGRKYVSPEGKHILPEGAFRKRFGGKKERLTGGVPPVRFKSSNGARRRPKTAVVAALNHGEAE